MSDEFVGSADGMRRRQFLARAASGVALAGAAEASAPSARGGEESASGEVNFRDRLLECLGGPWPEPCE